MKYTLTLFMTRYLKVGDEWQDVDVKRTFTYSDKDAILNIIDYLTEGAKGSVKFEIEAVEKEA